MEASTSKNINSWAMESDDDTEGTNLTSNNHGHEEDYDFDISDDDFVPSINTNTPVSTVIFKQQPEELSFSTIDQTLGSILGINLDESLLVPEVIPDFGQAEFTTGARGGALLTYHSKKYPGKVFHFKIYGQSSSQRRYFACKGCMDMKRLYELKEKFPIIVVKNGRIIEIDPDNPKEEHYCLKREESGEDENGDGTILPKIYGPVSFEDGKRNAKILVYESKKLEGHKFRFRCPVAVAKNKNAKYYCNDCWRIKHKLGLSHNIPKIIVRHNQIIGTDPDSPEDEHFCVPGTQNFPESGESLLAFFNKPDVEEIDRGPATLIDGARGGQNLVYESQRFPGHKFLYRKSGPPWKGLSTFACDLCSKYKSRFGLSYEIPKVKVRDGRIVGDDPDYPTNEHFCHPELPNYPLKVETEAIEETPTTEDWTQDYGVANLIKGTRGGTILVYNSLIYPGQQLKFRKSGAYTQIEAERFICAGCMNMSKQYGLTYAIPSICVKDGRIIGRDPDRPNSEHFCVPGSVNCPMSEMDQQNTSQNLVENHDQPVIEFDETKDFGNVKFIKGKMGGHILVYDSLKYQGHQFKFRLVPNSASSYVCITCRKLKLKRGLDFKLPTIKVKEGKIIGYDPDSPTNDHFCLPQCDNYPLKEGEYLDFKGDEEIDYGPAKFVKGLKMGQVLVYESQRYPGIVFRFRKSSGMSTTGATHYACSRCISVKLKKGLSNIAPYIRIRNGRIVGQNPDYPKNEHFCVNEEDALENSRNMSSSFIEPCEIKDYGPAKYYNGKQGGQNVVVHSQRFPGHSFKFVKTSNVMADGSRSYICLLCRKLKRNHGLPNRLPIIRVKNGRIIIYDPEQPPSDHFCHPSCEGYPAEAEKVATEQENVSFEDNNRDYGPAKFVENNRGGKIIVYDSIRYPGYQFRFNTHGGPNVQGVRFYKCMKCSRIKLNLGLPNKLPCIKLNNNHIIGKDPDFPGNEHFCIEGTSNYPFYGKEDPFKEKPLKGPSQALKRTNDYGRAKLNNPSDPNSNITYDSIEIPGHKFEFARVGENNEKGALFYICLACKELKKTKKFSEKVPYIKVIRGRIVEWNPDQPKVSHFCVDNSLHTSTQFQDPKISINPMVELESYTLPASASVTIKKEVSYFDDDTNTTMKSSINYFEEPVEKKPRIGDLIPNTSCASATVEIRKGEILFQENAMEISNHPPPEPIPLNALDVPVLKSSTIQMTILQNKNPSTHNRSSMAGKKYRRSILEASASDLLLTEYSFLTKKVRLQTDEWTKHDENISLPNSDVSIPAKKHVDMNSLQNSRYLDLSKFTLKEKFDNVSTVFSMDSSIDTLLITDSLLQCLDETVLKKVSIVRAEFPIMPKWIGSQISSITFSDKESPSIIYALGFDWLIYFNSNPAKAIANLIKNEIIDILNAVQTTLNASEKALQFVFITIPEIGNYQLRFQEFNMEICRHIREISMRFPKCNLEVLDWAQMIKNADFDKIKTVDRRIRLLFENTLQGA